MSEAVRNTKNKFRLRVVAVFDAQLRSVPGQSELPPRYMHFLVTVLIAVQVWTFFPLMVFCERGCQNVHLMPTILAHTNNIPGRFFF